jgi:4-amino-4-deoxy-L-arabinose transferase-like glycosyltransferase
MPFLIAALLATGLALGLLTPAMDYDAAQYAAMAMEMLQRGQWLQVFERGQPYLDKPPLVFWTAAAAYRAFGVHDWAYKVPSLVAFVVAVWSTGRLAGTLSGDDDTARLARWTFATSVGALLMVADPRTDTLLVAAVAFATWQGAAFLRSDRTAHLLWAAVGVGVGMLAKGPMGAVAPVAALLGDVVAHRRWARLATWRLVLAVAVVAALLAPMCWGLYTQYGARGLTFFFWTQSFGRVTGSNVWRNDAGPLFFVHTFAWTFLPWAPVVVWRWWGSARAWWRGEGWGRDDALAVTGFALLFVAISVSRYKLPHYCYVLLPHASVLAARALRGRGHPMGRAWRRVIAGQAWLVPVAATALAVWAFGPMPWWGWVVLVLGAMIGAGVRRLPAPAPTVLGAATAFGVGAIVLNGVVAPRVFAYQVETTAGHLVRAAHVPDGAFVAVRHHRPSLDLAAERVVPDLPDVATAATTLGLRDSLWVFVRRESADSVARLGVRADTVAALQKFGVSRLNGRFVNPATRRGVTESWLLVRVWR